MTASTSDRILEGALRALGRHGSDKLRMTSVSEAAGVSRGTLYRYFPTKDALLAALAQYEQERFDVAMSDALDDADPTRSRLEVVLGFVFRYLRDHPALFRLRKDEPGFVLAYLGRQQPFLRRATQRVLGEELARSAPVVAGRVSPGQLVDVIVDVLIADFLVPGDPTTLAQTMTALLDLPDGQAGTATADLSSSRT